MRDLPHVMVEQANVRRSSRALDATSRAANKNIFKDARAGANFGREDEFVVSEVSLMSCPCQPQ